jgi:hypothetical protein
MGCRRKLKTERELVADINKTFSAFCKQRECSECPYRYSIHCKLDYITDLLFHDYEECGNPEEADNN